MRLLLIRRDDEREPITKIGAGVLTGLCLTYMTRYGFPVAYTPSQADKYAQAVGSIVPPAPGMIVIPERLDDLYVIDIDGEAHPIGLRATRPQSTSLAQVEHELKTMTADVANRIGPVTESELRGGFGGIA